MPTPTVAAKEQIVLRHEVSQHLGVAPSQKLMVDKMAHGGFSLQAQTSDGLESLVGCLPQAPKALSLEQIDTLTIQSWAKQKMKAPIHPPPN